MADLEKKVEDLAKQIGDDVGKIVKMLGIIPVQETPTDPASIPTDPPETPTA